MKIVYTMIRLVRKQKEQSIVNLPSGVLGHLGISPGDGINFELVDGGFVAMSKVTAKSITDSIGKKV